MFSSKHCHLIMIVIYNTIRNLITYTLEFRLDTKTRGILNNCAIIKKKKINYKTNIEFALLYESLQLSL